MFKKHVIWRLLAYCQKELPEPERQRVAEHLSECPKCRKACDEIQLGVALARQIAVQPAPEGMWEEISAALDPALTRPASANWPAPTRKASGVWRWTLAATFLLLVAVAGGGWYYWRLSQPSWEVARLEGSPRVGWGTIEETGRLAVGDWLETDDSSRALINVGEIGEVEIERNTRVRLLNADEHRLRLARGTMHATIWAPPRSFVVDTPSAVATDLGCSYTLEVDEAGIGRLYVSSGWVAFELKGRESFVPAGAMCETRPNIGPGTPYYEDAPPLLIQALDRFDFESGGSAALELVLSEARQQDAFTVWHLLSRVSASERPRVFARLATLVPPPKAVSRDGILRLDRDMLDLWWNELGLDDASWWRIWKSPFPQNPQ
jgi:hypothetical protein